MVATMSTRRATRAGFDEVVSTDQPVSGRRTASSSQTPRVPTEAERKLPTRSTVRIGGVTSGSAG